MFIGCGEQAHQANAFRGKGFPLLQGYLLLPAISMGKVSKPDTYLQGFGKQTGKMKAVVAGAA